ncbi:hypothetical protein [Actinoplanes sp. NPDC051411]|uniref:hypothetical protein n=1 Tax=Actinoplanes sp. NPDC051411 TaxID=3155522 RepID=UPI003422E789
MPIAASAVSQGPWWTTPTVALIGALVGAATTLLTTFLLDSRRARRDADLAEQGRRREAYLEILSWLARSRDELRRSINDRRPFNHDFVDEREQGRLDALSELAATPEFRHALSQWPDAFQAALRSYKLFVSLPESTPEELRARRDVGGQLEGELKTLQDIIEAIRIQARRDTAPDHRA